MYQYWLQREKTWLLGLTVIRELYLKKHRTHTHTHTVYVTAWYYYSIVILWFYIVLQSWTDKQQPNPFRKIFNLIEKSCTGLSGTKRNCALFKYYIARETRKYLEPGEMSPSQMGFNSSVERKKCLGDSVQRQRS